MKTSIGICAYNEEKNIAKLLDALLAQKTKNAEIIEIIVVASGCTDNTVPIVESYAKKNRKIKLLVQDKKMGKASAVNLFIQNAHGDIMVLESADTIPIESTIEELILPFEDPKVGMTGGRPIPLNDKDTFTGVAVHLVWNLHHRMAEKHPKLGEIVAFRNLIRKISEETAVDEAYIESALIKDGYRLDYAPRAVVYNRGPESIRDFILQRKRIYIGHLHLKKNFSYTPSTENIFQVILLLLKENKARPRNNFYTFLAVLLDIYIRCLAYLEFYVLGRNPYNWTISKTTKDVSKKPL